MLDMGFKPVVDRIVRMTPSDRQTLLFSATLEGEVGRIAAAYTRAPRRHEVAPAPEKVGHVEHRFRRVAHEHKVTELVHELGDPKRGLTLVFVRTKRGADRLVKRLGRHDVDAVAMHGDKSQSQREKALARFESGRIDTLIATDVAARGIDVTGVTHVINYDAPAAREDYVHRVGRTARAGASGVGITFVLDDQAREVAKFASELGLEHGLGVEVPARGRPRRARRARPVAGGSAAAANGGIEEGRVPVRRDRFRRIVRRRFAVNAGHRDDNRPRVARSADPSPQCPPFARPPARGSAEPAGLRLAGFAAPLGSGSGSAPRSPRRGFFFGGRGRTTFTVRPRVPSRPSGPRAETRTSKRPRDGGVQLRSWPPRSSRMSRASTTPRGP